ncbi:MAG: SRPBCC domain-containing protein [Myxococcales bacterium]|nr:SRPBCC domain-containing protein [Myxococcales bacterium]
MPVTSVVSDPEALTITAVGDYPVPVARLWQAWMDPRQLEQFWGPPSWPATFTAHEAREGGLAQYQMSGPQGETSRGYWRFETIEPERRIVVWDGFADADGAPSADLPETRMEIAFEATGKGSRFTAVSTFQSLAALEQMVAMGMVEGLSAALAQLDDVVAELRAWSASMHAALTVVDDTHIVVRRTVRGSLAQVWRAHHEPELIKRWMLGPDGWSMPVCEVAVEVGQTYRYEWENAADGGRFGFTGELLEAEAPRRAVVTEGMIGMDGPPAVNELLLVPQPGNRTLIELRITYPSREVRDLVIGTGMVDGMEISYARLEQAVLAA